MRGGGACARGGGYARASLERVAVSSSGVAHMRLHAKHMVASRSVKSAAISSAPRRKAFHSSRLRCLACTITHDAAAG